MMRDEHRGTASKGHRHQSGLSLVELMVSLVISSVLTLGLIEIFTAHQTSHKLLQEEDALASSGQMAIALLSRSLMQAGYQGCNSKTPLSNNMSKLPYAFDLEQGLRGYEANVTAWASNHGNLSARDLKQLTGLPSQRLMPGTDLVTVWFAGKQEFNLDTLSRPLMTGAEALLLDAPKKTVGSAFKYNPVALMSDCFTKNIFLITRISARSRQTELEHAAGITLKAAQNATAILGDGKGYGQASMVLPVTSHTYFVARSAHLNQQQEVIYSLFRKDGSRGPVELIEGIEDLQLLYGIAERGKVLAPTTYLDASQVVDFKAVVSVRIAVTAKAVEAGFSSARGGPLSTTLARTIRLPNHFIRMEAL